MAVMAESSVIPIGTGGPSVGKLVADALKALAAHPNVRHELSAMGTTLIGELNDVLLACGARPAHQDGYASRGAALLICGGELPRDEVGGRRLRRVRDGCAQPPTMMAADEPGGAHQRLGRRVARSPRRRRPGGASGAVPRTRRPGLSPGPGATCPSRRRGVRPLPRIPAGKVGGYGASNTSVDPGPSIRCP